MPKFIPAWKDDAGNRFFVLATNHVCDSREEAVTFQLENFIFYIPFGWVTAGVVELALEDGAGRIPHAAAKGPFGFDCCCIEGPLFEAAMANGFDDEGEIAR